jgi:hypothetical protein
LIFFSFIFRPLLWLWVLLWVHLVAWRLDWWVILLCIYLNV